jgi:hypothetical protein
MFLYRVLIPPGPPFFNDLAAYLRQVHCHGSKTEAGGGLKLHRAQAALVPVIDRRPGAG